MLLVQQALNFIYLSDMYLKSKEINFTYLTGTEIVLLLMVGECGNKGLDIANYSAFDLKKRGLYIESSTARKNLNCLAREHYIIKSGSTYYPNPEYYDEGRDSENY